MKMDIFGLPNTRMIRGRPCPLHLGQRKSLRTTRTDASGSRGFIRKSSSPAMPQLSQMMTTHGDLAVSAVVIFGQNHAEPRLAS